MAFINVTDAVGVAYTLNTDQVILLREMKNVNEVVLLDGNKVNLKPEEAARVRELLSKA